MQPNLRLLQQFHLQVLLLLHPLHLPVISETHLFQVNSRKGSPALGLDKPSLWKSRQGWYNTVKCCSHLQQLPLGGSSEQIEQKETWKLNASIKMYRKLLCFRAQEWAHPCEDMRFSSAPQRDADHPTGGGKASPKSLRLLLQENSFGHQIQMPLQLEQSGEARGLGKPKPGLILWPSSHHFPRCQSFSDGRESLMKAILLLDSLLWHWFDTEEEEGGVKMLHLSCYKQSCWRWGSGRCILHPQLPLTSSN